MVSAHIVLAVMQSCDHMHLKGGWEIKSLSMVFIPENHVPSSDESLCSCGKQGNRRMGISSLVIKGEISAT